MGVNGYQLVKVSTKVSTVARQPPAKRRLSGEGTLFYDRTRKCWVGRITVRGTRRSVTGQTKSEARRKLDGLRDELAARGRVTAGDLTVAGLLAEWLGRGLPARNVQEPTIARHEWAARVLTDEIGTLRVHDLSPIDIEDMLDRRAAAGRHHDPSRGLSRASLEKLRTTLALALAWAERRGQVNRNVARLAELPSSAARPTGRRRSMSLDQAQAFLIAAEGTIWEPMWVLGLLLGLRPGEAAGLSWDDVHGDVIHVHQALKRRAGGALVIGEPKTPQSVRSLDITEEVHAALRRRRRTQNIDRVAAGELWSNPANLIHTNSVGRPVDPARSRREFEQVVTAAGIGDGWTPNDLRHTAASLMSDAGVPVERLADQLGHRDTRMASLHYRHRVRPTTDAGRVMAEVLRLETGTS